MRERPDAPLGTLIFRAGLLPAEVIENALEEGVRTGRRLGEILVERGLIQEEDLTRLLAGQKGLPFVALADQSIDPAAPGLLGEEQAKLFCALPIAFENGTPVVALADPTNDVLTRNVAEAIGRPTNFVVASRSELLETIGRVYGGAPAPPAAEPVQPESEPVESEPAETVPFAAQPAPAAPLDLQPVPAPPDPEPQQEAPLPPAAPEPAPEPELELPPVLPAAEHPSEPAPVPETAPAAPHEGNGHHPEVTLEPPVAPVPEEAPEDEAPAVPAPSVEPVAAPAPAPPAPSAPSAPSAPQPAAEVPSPAYEEPREAAEPALRPPNLRVPAPEPDEEPAPSAEAATTRVTIRLTNGEKVPVADFTTLEGATVHARGLIRTLGESGEDWPLVNGRFLKPDTIVSVDVEPL